MSWLATLKCKLTRHYFDVPRYRIAIEDYYDLHKYLHLPPEEFYKHIENPPNPYCKRCKKEI
jgi:hypothetical protein